MRKYICQKCRYFNETEQICYKRKSRMYADHSCGHFEEVSRANVTIFDRITTSPEVLAEKLIYWEHDECDGWWESSILDGKFDTKAEAIAATVARLKEVAE